MKEAVSRPAGMPLDDFILRRSRDYFEEWVEEIPVPEGRIDIDSYLETLYNKINRITG